MALGLAVLALPACAAGSYASISLAAGAADPELQALAARARAGDRSSQLELGLRFEEGRGVPRDRARACEAFLAQPGRSSPDLWLYSPATRSLDHYPARRAPAPPADALAVKALQCRLAAAGETAR